jgi:hypothetical protein
MCQVASEKGNWSAIYGNDLHGHNRLILSHEPCGVTTDQWRSISRRSFGFFYSPGVAAFIHGAVVCCATSAQAIRTIERSHGSRVITMIHRQEKRSLFGFIISWHIDLEGA